MTEKRAGFVKKAKNKIGEKLPEIKASVGEKASSAKKSISEKTTVLKTTIGHKAPAIKSKVVDKIPNVSVNDALRAAIRVPGVNINRTDFLERELRTKFPKEIVEKAISTNPAQAGITKEDIDSLAKQCINLETNSVSAISFAAGVPGGLAMIATVPADITQYFAFTLRIMQKLAYLYGFDDFQINNGNVSDETMNEILFFLGVMFGVQEATAAVKVIAETASKKAAKSLARKALTKGAVYPIVKKIATSMGFKMTKQIFANCVAKAIPIIGGITTGALTYVTFKPSANRLKKSFKSLPYSDPEFYKSIDEPIIIDVKAVEEDECKLTQEMEQQINDMIKQETITEDEPDEFDDYKDVLTAIEQTDNCAKTQDDQV